MIKTINKQIEHASKIKKEVTAKLVTLIISAFGLVAALAWNDAIKSIFANYIEPVFGAMAEMWSMIIYAVVVTIIAVIITISIGRISGKQE